MTNAGLIFYQSFLMKHLLKIPKINNVLILNAIFIGIQFFFFGFMDTCKSGFIHTGATQDVYTSALFANVITA